VPGPKGAVRNAKELAAERAALGLRRQIVNRIKQLNKMPESRRERSRAQLKKEYARVSAKMSKYGFDVPPLKELIEDPQAWLTADLAPINDDSESAEASVQEVVQDAYLRTLSRYPDDDELQTAVSFINESETPAGGIQSLMWALVNTKEFIITH
jgi:hypothetical protein